MKQKLSFLITTLIALAIGVDAVREADSWSSTKKGILQKPKPAGYQPKVNDMKEIIAISLYNTDRVKPLARNQKDVYVEFHHCGGLRGTSLPLYPFHVPSLANLPLLADDEGIRSKVICTIKRKNKELLQGQFDLKDIKDDEVWVNMTTMRGDPTGALLKLNIFDTDWIGDLDLVENPKDTQEQYYKSLGYGIDKLTGIFFVGGIEQLRLPSETANPDLPSNELLKGLVVYPKKDEFNNNFMKRQVLRFMPLFNKYMPFKDKSHPVPCRMSMRNEIRKKIMRGLVSKPTEGEWIAPLSDESMHRVCFYNFGMWFMKKFEKPDEEGNLYFADMTYLSTLRYRRDYENLGCKVFFNKKAHITKIEDHDGTVYRPGDKMWCWAKQKARSNGLIMGSMSHLCCYHLRWGNIPAMAVRKYLPPDHPWRIAMTTHFFRTHETCLLAKDFLIAERGPLHRGLPFEYEGGYIKIFTDLLENFKFQEYPDELESVGLKDDKYHLGATDGMCLREAFMKYASNLVDEIFEMKEGERDPLEEDGAMRDTFRFMVDELKVPSHRSAYTRENVKVVWGEILFRVTGAHTCVGNAGIVALEPFMLNFRMNRDPKITGNRETISVVSSITGLTQPAVYPGIKDDWRHLLHDPMSKSYKTFKEDLDLVRKEIDQRNKVRRYNNVDFHPDNVMISIFS